MEQSSDTGAPLEQSQCDSRDTLAVPANPGNRTGFGSVCGKCGALLPDRCGRCLVCGAQRGAAPYDGVFPVDSGQQDPVGPRARAPETAGNAWELWRRWAKGLSALIAMVFAVFTGLWAYRQFFDTSTYRAAQAVVYAAPDHRLMLYYPGVQRPFVLKGISMESEALAGGVVGASANGRWLCYTTASGRLYLLDLARPAEADGAPALEASLLAEQVAQPAVFANSGDCLVYLTKGQELYACDLAESWKVDTGVAAIIAVEGGKVLYTRHGDQTSGVDLFLESLSRDSGEWLTIDRNVVEVLDWTKGFERIVYTGLGEGGSALSLHAFDKKANTTAVLAGGVDQVADTDARTSSAVYLVARPQRFSYGSFIDDNLAEADARLEEPKLEDYPDLAQAVQTESRVSDEADIVDNEQLLEQDISYNQAWNAWEDKLERDALRTRLRSLFSAPTDFISLYDLYVYRDGGRSVLASDLLVQQAVTPGTGAVSVEQNYAMYETVHTGGLPKLRISDIWQLPQVRQLDFRRYYVQNIPKRLFLAPLDGAPIPLYIDNDSAVHRLWRMSPKADGVYFTVGPPGALAQGEGRDDLYYAPFKNSAVGEAALCARSVHALQGSFRDGVLFTAGESGRELYLAQNGSALRLGQADTRVGSVESSDGTLLYFDRQAQQTGADLRMLIREDVLVCRDVTAYEYRSDQLVYVQKPGDSQGGVALYAWVGGRETLVEQNARAIVGFTTGKWVS